MDYFQKYLDDIGIVLKNILKFILEKCCSKFKSFSFQEKKFFSKLYFEKYFPTTSFFSFKKLFSKPLLFKKNSKISFKKNFFQNCFCNKPAFESCLLKTIYKTSSFLKKKLFL